jgi:hypothetical protein
VPEADVAAAMSDRGRLQQLINQIYHSDSAATQSSPPSAAAPAADDGRWAGRAPAAPVVLPPQAGQSGAPYWTQALDDAPGAPGAVRPAAPPQPTTPGTAAQNLKAQYDTLVPILGPQKAMLALMNPEAGKTLLNAALTAHALRMKGVPEIDNGPLNGMDPIGPSTGNAAGFNSPNQIRSGPPGGARGALSGPPQNSSDQSAADPTVQLAQYAPAIPGLPMPVPSGVYRPGTPENDAWTSDFIHQNIRAGHEIGNLIGGILHNENDENAVRPPAGSKPINETPWSGDHTKIKQAAGAGAKDDVRISPKGEVWAQHPDGSWTNYGDVRDFTGSGRPKGRRGKDRDQW